MVSEEEMAVLYNLLQKYLYEMTLYYNNDLNESGNYEYKYLPLYFSESDRQAYFIYNDNTMVGFTLINKHSWTNEETDNCIAEFTIFPMFRKHRYAMEAVKELIRLRPGTWQLKYSKDNKIGTAFWKKVAEIYKGEETELTGNEIAVKFK